MRYEQTYLCVFFVVMIFDHMISHLALDQENTPHTMKPIYIGYSHISQSLASIQSQCPDWTTEVQEYWSHRACGACCIAMVLGYLGYLAKGENGKIPLRDIVAQHERRYRFASLHTGDSKDYAYFSRHGGWLHYGLAQIARSYGYAGTYAQKPMSEVPTIEQWWLWLRQGYHVICSVHRQFLPSMGGHHLVLLAGVNIQAQTMTFHDPEQPEAISISYEQFCGGFLRRCIWITTARTERTMSYSPIYCNVQHAWEDGG
jgi:hypothetical protein